MNADPGPWNSIVFTVPREQALELRHWQQQTNLRLIAADLALNGRAHVILRREGRFHYLTELPAPGEAEPMIGTNGGHYTYVFSPQGDSCGLHVHVSPAAFPFLKIEPIAPLALRLPVETVELTTSTPRYGHDWSGPYTAPEGEHLVHEVLLDEPEFPINGTMYQRLQEWGWDPLQVEAYFYIFVPTTVGDHLAVMHVASEQEILLTKDEMW